MARTDHVMSATDGVIINGSSLSTFAIHNCKYGVHDEFISALLLGGISDCMYVTVKRSF